MSWATNNMKCCENAVWFKDHFWSLWWVSLFISGLINFSLQCSVQPCYSEENINYYDVKDFKEDYGTVGQSFACYYNPSTLGEVFVQHADSSSDHMKILHSILWPMLIVVIAASMLGILFCKSKGHCCYKKSGAPVPYQNLQATTWNSWELAWSWYFRCS